MAGLGIVENAYDQTAKIQAVAPHEFEDREKELLVLAKAWMPRLPFKAADVLLLDQIGKNISGSGMDTNVVGRKFNDHVAAENEWPKIKRIVVRDLTDETHGNATGMGMAEFCRSRVVEKTNIEHHADQLPDRRPPDRGHAAARLSDRPRGARCGLPDDRPDRAAAGQADVGPQHAGSGRGRVQRGVSERSPRAAGPDDPPRAAAAPLDAAGNLPDRV